MKEMLGPHLMIFATHTHTHLVCVCVRVVSCVCCVRVLCVCVACVCCVGCFCCVRVLSVSACVVCDAWTTRLLAPPFEKKAVVFAKHIAPWRFVNVCQYDYQFLGSF